MEERINDNSEVTANSKQVEALKKHFPQCFDKQGKFMLKRLEEVVADNGIELTKESYSLNWLGKSYARLLANENPRTWIAEDKEHNQQLEHQNSENMLIKGDNLEVLKHLVNAYSEKVKMIYIDPPYNTGKDGFIYEDDRRFTDDELSRLAGIDINEARRVLEFTQSKANSHSAWLTFMYPRLYVARELLKKDGVIFISIDDNELAQLRLLCDLIMGEENYLGSIIWKNVTDNNPSNIATEHENILVYARSKKDLEPVWRSELSDVKDLLVDIGRRFVEKYSDPEERQRKYSEWFKKNKFQLNELDRYKYIDSGGVYTGSQSVHNPGKEGYRYDVVHPKTGMPCAEPLMGYRFSPKKMDQLLSENKIIFGDDHNKIIELKVYAKDYLEKLSSIFELDGRLGANELRALFPEFKKVFTNPKPSELIVKLISFATNESDIVLDFFAGSGTTAHAVMKLNEREGTSRKYIAVQAPEPCDEKSEVFKAGYENIFQITKERLVRSRESIKENNPDFDGDLEFKIYQTVPVPEGYFDDIEELDAQQTLFDGSECDPDQLEALIATWKAYDGVFLTESAEVVELAGYPAWYVDDNLYLLDTGFTTEALKALVEKLDDDKDFSPSKVVLFGYNFSSKHQREMKEALSNYANKKSIDVDLKVRY